MLSLYADKVHFLEIPETLKPRNQNEDKAVPKYDGADFLLPADGAGIPRIKKKEILKEKSNFSSFLQNSNLMFARIVIYFLNFLVFLFHCLVFLLVKFYYLILGVTAGFNFLDFLTNLKKNLKF